MYVREYGKNLLLFAIWDKCVHCMRGGVVFVGGGSLSCWPMYASLTDMPDSHTGTAHSHLENVKQLIVEKNLCMTLSSVQNPIELRLEAVLISCKIWQ